MSTKKGFTLVELLVGITIVLLIFGSIIGIFGSSFKLSQTGLKQQEAYAEARQALQEIKTTLRYADKNSVVFNAEHTLMTYSGKYFDKHWEAAQGANVLYRMTLDFSNGKQLIIKKELVQGTEKKQTVLTFPKVEAHSAFISTREGAAAPAWLEWKNSGTPFPVREIVLAGANNAAADNIVYEIILPLKYLDAEKQVQTDVLQTTVGPTDFDDEKMETTLKANYTAEYMAATLSRNLNDITEITKLMDECKRMGISVLGPDVNESSDTFTVNKNGDIRFGMAGIKGVGGAAVESIVAARETSADGFVSIFDFIERVNLSSVNKKTIESLIYSGAFDRFEVKREQFFALNSKEEPFIDALVRYGNRYQSDVIMGGNSLFGTGESIKPVPPEIPAAPDVDNLELLKREKELVGMYLSSHPLDQYSFEVKYFTNTSIAECADMVVMAVNDTSLQGKECIIAGIVTSVRVSYSKSSGKPFVNFTLEDFNGSTSFTLYGKDYENFMKYTQVNLPLLLKCVIQPKFGFGGNKNGDQAQKPMDYELKIKSIRHLANTKEDFIRQITLNVPIKRIDKYFRKSLVDALKHHKGPATVVIKALDYENQIAVEFFSTKYSITVSKELIEYLENNSIDYSFTPTLSF